MQNILLICCIVAVVVPSGWAASHSGGKTNLTHSEVSSHTVQKHKQPATNKIKDHKSSTNSLASCVDYDAEITEGTRQIVRGVSYDLKVKITPKKSTSSDCKKEHVNLSNVPSEVCDVNVWVRPGDIEEPVYRVVQCNTIEN